MKKIFVGTSGYNYSHWREVFYPPRLSSTQWLNFYTQHFNCVELNVTFYRLPKEAVFKNWYKNTPRNFRFVLKGSRFITHIKRLKDPQEALKIFFKNASFLKEKALCILWQLPPSLKADFFRLESFLEILHNNYGNYHHSLEFRNKTWFCPTTYTLLKKFAINLCIADSPHYPCEEVLTSSFVYLRFHGGRQLYSSEYTQKELELWADKAFNWLKKKNTLLVFFNNDAYGFAVKNSLEFRKLLEEKLKTKS